MHVLNLSKCEHSLMGAAACAAAGGAAVSAGQGTPDRLRRHHRAAAAIVPARRCAKGRRNAAVGARSGIVHFLFGVQVPLMNAFGRYI